MTQRTDWFYEARRAIQESGSVERIVAQLVTDPKLKHGEWWACSPLRDDRHPGSFAVCDETGLFIDFATGDKGDLITLAARALNVRLVDAAKWIASELGYSVGTQIIMPTPTRRLREEASPRVDSGAQVWSASADDSGPIFPASVGKNTRFADGWCYQFADGTQALWIARYDCLEDRKTFRPFHYTPEGWRMGDPQGLLPMYNLPAVTNRPPRVVLIVEGEKTAEAAARIFPDVTPTTNAHGANSVQRTDWWPLKGRTVLIWGDHDPAGKAHVAALVEAIRNVGAASVRVVQIPSHWPSGWDLADAPPEGANLRNLLDSSKDVV